MNQTKKTPFLFVYKNGYEGKELIVQWEIKGIRISPKTVVALWLCIDYPAEESFSCGLQEREFEDRTELLTKEDVEIIRNRLPEFNHMLRRCNAYFRVPQIGPCWVSAGSKPSAIFFGDGTRVETSKAWGMYKFL